MDTATWPTLHSEAARRLYRASLWYIVVVALPLAYLTFYRTEYVIAFFEVNGSGLNSEFLTTSFLSESALTLWKPTLQPTNFSVSDISGNGMKISCEAGDGACGIVLAKRGGPVNANPIELTSYRVHSRVEYSGSNSITVIGDNNFSFLVIKMGKITANAGFLSIFKVNLQLLLLSL